jgi:hypothetical protein
MISKFDVHLDKLFTPTEDLTPKSLATFVSLAGNLKNEAADNFGTSTYTLGSSLAFDLGFLFPFQADEKSSTYLQDLNFLDRSSPKRPIASPRFVVGYDRVFEADRTTRPVSTGSTADQYNRAYGAIAWGLPVFTERSYATIVWETYIDLDAKKNRRHNFVDVELTYSLTDVGIDKKGPVNILVKYIGGTLPPNFGRESAVVAGLSISLK